MRAKNDRMEWYFDILNPVLAEICRKYRIKSFITGNLIRSKGTTGSIYEQEKRIVESYTCDKMDLPGGGSVACWFAQMAKNAKLITDDVANQITALAPYIDPYTYCYDIEQIYIAPHSTDSYIKIEKRDRNEICQYGFTEEEFTKYSKKCKQDGYPSEKAHTICDKDDDTPLCEYLNEGTGTRPCYSSELYFVNFWSGVKMNSYIYDDTLRNIIREETEVKLDPKTLCAIPSVDNSDSFNGAFSKTAFSVTFVKNKKVISDFIKQQGGTCASAYSPKTSVYIAGNTPEKKFLGNLGDLIKNSLLNGIARKTLGDDVALIKEEDFLLLLKNK